MARRTRLDSELVRRGLARSRQQAAELVHAGHVLVRGMRARKPATLVDPADPVVVDDRAVAADYVSRGGHKLAGALAAFGAAGPPVRGRRCLDAGAAAGGFTDVLLRAGAAEVVAVDVGYGQLDWTLRNDPRVRVHERTNIRTLTPELIGGLVDVTVADLSFISLRLVLPALAECTAPDGDLVVMVKPQFEVGRGNVGPGGVVRDPELRTEAALGVAAVAVGLGLGVAGVAPSLLPGPSGNRELFLWLHRGAPAVDRARVRVAAGGGKSEAGTSDAGPAGAGAAEPEARP